MIARPRRPAKATSLRWLRPIGQFPAGAAQGSFGSSGSCPACPFASAGRNRHPGQPVRRGRARESLNFTLKRIRAERVQIVNATLEAQLLQRIAFLRRLLERLRVARHVFNIDAGERIAELMLGSG